MSTIPNIRFFATKIKADPQASLLPNELVEALEEESGFSIEKGDYVYGVPGKYMQGDPCWNI
jgi:hypothetical protein